MTRHAYKKKMLKQLYREEISLHKKDKILRDKIKRAEDRLDKLLAQRTRLEERLNANLESYLKWSGR